MRITQEDMQERRNTIVRTAFRLFCDDGIEHVSLSAIARQAQVSDNTLYRYFENKATLVQEAFDAHWCAMMQNVAQIATQAPRYDALTGYEQMRLWIEGFHHLYQADREFVLFSYEAKLYLLRQHVRMDQLQQDMLMQSFYAPCVAALDKGKADGSIPAQERSEDLFYAILGTIQGYIVKIVIFGALYGVESPWEYRYQMMERGILSALHAGWSPP